VRISSSFSTTTLTLPLLKTSRLWRPWSVSSTCAGHLLQLAAHGTTPDHPLELGGMFQWACCLLSLLAFFKFEVALNAVIAYEVRTN
jgi:hypothetical protein